MILLYALAFAALAREPAPGGLDPATWSGPPALAPSATVQSPRYPDAEKVGAGITVHVLLQVHPRFDGDKSVDTPESARCREQAVSTVLGSGVTAVVAEGLMRGGTLDAPSPVRPTPPPTSIGGAVGRYRGIAVYGFEDPEVHERSTGRMLGMQRAGEGMTRLRDEPLTDAQKLARLDVLQRDFFAANTEFATAALPLRSFQALQTALAVAAARKETSVFLVIGRAHWPDLPHAVKSADRLGNDRFIGLRLVRYDCT